MSVERTDSNWDKHSIKVAGPAIAYGLNDNHGVMELIGKNTIQSKLAGDLETRQKQWPDNSLRTFMHAVVMTSRASER